MPKNKDALIRFRVINKCLREREFATLQDRKGFRRNIRHTKLSRKMIKNQFSTEFKKRFKENRLKLYPAENPGDFFLINEHNTNMFLLRTVIPGIDPEGRLHLKQPINTRHPCHTLLFRFSLEDLHHPVDFVILIPGIDSERNDFMIFRRQELENHLKRLKLRHDEKGYYKLLMWFFPFSTGLFPMVGNDIGFEGEWYLLGGFNPDGGPAFCMAYDSDFDFSKHLNRWNLF